ncbi:unnamed protein product [Dracunculus medinensis]|uniref:ABC transporter domain-containing protein n=1 Tax=Dracunculus medinensis TaxID=318479 RepID=A0A3P7SIG0_DRAME|nr:unnamed protein product [Dracunculus medinensis]
MLKLGGRYAELVKAQQFTIDEHKSEEGIGIHDTEEKEEQEEEEELHLESNDPLFRRHYRRHLSSTRSKKSSFGSTVFMRANSISDDQNRSSQRFSITGTEALFPKTETVTLADEITFESNKNPSPAVLPQILGILCTIVFGLHLPALSMVFSFVFRAFKAGPSDTLIDDLYYSFAMYGGLGIGILLVQFASNAFFGLFSENLVFAYRIRAFRNILYQDATYFDDPKCVPGKLITRLASDAPNMKAVVDSRMVQVIAGITSLVVNVIIGLNYCWQVTVVGASFSIFLGVIQIILSRWVYHQNIRIALSDEAGRTAIEVIENVTTIQLLTREKVFFEKYESASKKQRRSEFKKVWIEGINFSITQSFHYFMQTFNYAAGIPVIANNMKPPADIFNAAMSMMLGAVGIMTATVYFPEFIKAQSSIKLLFNMMDRVPKTGYVNNGQKYKIRGNILFEKVKFAYPQKPRNLVMRELQFTVSRGQTVAIVGPSGSGKSTVISLLERFYDPIAGYIRLDGIDLQKMDLSYLRTQMALVGQEPRLFSGTVRQNVCFGLDEEVSDERIYAALELANAKTFVSALPKGIETDVGEKGMQLSGGQKQRLAIARAMIRNPKILLLDEATSALDSESERAVQEALDRARAGRTCITIAHRLSSIQNADIIFYLDNGRVRETGNHSTLMASGGLYYKLIKKQDLSS